MDAARHRRMAVARRSFLAKPGLLRTAKSCGPGAAMLASSPWEASFSGVTVTTSPLHRGEHEVSRKAVAQGMSECFRSPVCSCAPTVCILAHETAGAARTRHSLRPRFSREAKNLHHSGEIAPREREVMTVSCPV